MYFPCASCWFRRFVQKCGSQLATLLCGLAVGLSLPAPVLAAVSKEPARLPQCSWNEPGHNPFMGDVVAAVDRYTDIPVDVRTRLKVRMARRQYDDMASIRRDSIEGTARYDAKLRDMHFGVGRVCSTVSRQAWLPSHQERGLVYCEGSECIIVPTVCRNVSRIKRDPSGVLASRDLLAPEAAPFADALLFDAPSAGPLQWSGADPAYGFTGSGLFQGDPGGPVPGGLPGALPGGPGGSEKPLSGPVPGSDPGSRSTGVVPEPQTWLLMLVGALALGGGQRWRRRTGSLRRRAPMRPRPA